MMTPPRLSVVMSVYNGLPFLSEALESVLNQTYREFEFVAVDDGSADDSWRVLSEYAARDKRMVLVRHQVNRGVASARNTGFRAAQGQYIACQDADDISLPDRFARQVEFLDRQPDVGMLGTWSGFIDEQGRPLDKLGFPRLSEDKDLQRQLLDSNCFCAGSVMIRRRHLEAVGGYDEGMALSEDYDLWLRLAEVTRLASIPAYLYLYRHHPASASSRHRSTLMKNKASVLERALSRRYASDPPDWLRGLLARDYLRAAHAAHAAGAASEARESLERTLKWAPRIWRSGPFLEGVLTRIFEDERVQDAIPHAEDLFDGLLPPTRHVRRVRSRVLSRLNMRVVFEAIKKGETCGVGGYLWSGVRNDPRWLLNRGVWIIGLRSLLAKSRGLGGQQNP